MTLAHFPLNPFYGKGVYRRLLRFSRVTGAVVATLDDTHHAMWLLIRHDGARISDVCAGISRGPATSCGGAIAGLHNLVDLPLSSGSGAIHAALCATDNCTHLADLATWAIRSAATQGLGVTSFHIHVADDDGLPFQLGITRDDRSVHRWLARGGEVVSPRPLAPMPLMRGFMAHAKRHFAGDALEAAIMLQRGFFVARGRRHLVDLAPPVPLRAAIDMADACYSYAGDRFHAAVSHVGYVRDFTAGVVPHPLPRQIADMLQGLDDAGH